MTKEEKENILKKLTQLKLNYRENGNPIYKRGVMDCMDDAIEIVKNAPITEPRETNLEHHLSTILNICETYVPNSYEFRCVLERELDVQINDDIGIESPLTSPLWWLAQPYEKPKYKLTQAEYDILDTLFDKEARFNKAYKTDELKNRGYFKNVLCDDNTRVKEILKNCEVVE